MVKEKRCVNIVRMMPDKPTSSDEGSDHLFVSSLEKAMRLLAAFGETHGEMGLAELARAADLDRSATQRFAATFHRLGYLEKDAVTRRFRPSVRFLELANAYLWSDAMLREAMPRLIDLRQALGETINFARLDGEDIVYLVRLPSARTSYGAMIAGRRLPALHTSSGRAMIGRFPPEERETAVSNWKLQSFTPKTLMDRDRIGSFVEAAARDQFAIASNEILLNEIGVAVAVAGRGGKPYAVQCSLSGTLWTEDRVRDEIVPHLHDVANALMHLGV